MHGLRSRSRAALESGRRASSSQAERPTRYYRNGNNGTLANISQCSVASMFVCCMLRFVSNASICLYADCDSIFCSRDRAFYSSLWISLDNLGSQLSCLSLEGGVFVLWASAFSLWIFCVCCVGHLSASVQHSFTPLFCIKQCTCFWSPTTHDAKHLD